MDQRDSMDKRESMSAVYSLASGIDPVAVTKQAPKSPIKWWQPSDLSRFDDAPPVDLLRANEELPELLDALFQRNMLWPSRMSGNGNGGEAKTRQLPQIATEQRLAATNTHRGKRDVQ